MHRSAIRIYTQPADVNSSTSPDFANTHATHKPVVLIIRDGWGINPDGRERAEANGDATLLAKTPFHDQLYAKYPRAR